MELAVIFGTENLAENGASLGGRRKQKPQKIPLGNHRDLGKLVSVNADKLGYGAGNLLNLGNNAAVGTDKGCVGRFGRFAAASFGGTGIFGVAAYGVNGARVIKFKLNKGWRFGGGIFAPQTVGLAARAACLAVKGEGDGVENGGFARSRVARYKVKAAFAEDAHVKG